MAEPLSEEEGKFVPIEWYVPEDLMSHYATNFVVQHTEHEFIISFFEFKPPILLGTPEEQRTQLEELESIRGTCVARIILSPERMAGFIQALTENYERYAKEKPTDEQGETEE